MSELPRLYRDLAEWWPLLSPPEDYAEEAEFYRRSIVSACERPPITLLELGSGGGNNASHLRQHFQLTLVDLSPSMLEVSRRLNPECEHVQGDMREIRLGRTFDAVFIHDAIAYLTTETDLRRAIETAFVHCAPGGAVVFAPDHTRETFRPYTEHGGNDGTNRGLRYLEWTWDPDPEDTTYRADMVYLLREGGMDPQVVLDRHLCGLFGHDTWIRSMQAAGFRAGSVPFVHSDLPAGSTEVFIGRKPSEPVPTSSTGRPSS